MVISIQTKPGLRLLGYKTGTWTIEKQMGPFWAKIKTYYCGEAAQKAFDAMK